MISRRTMLRSGAVVGAAGVAGFAANQAGVLDDGLRAIGIQPHAEPDPHDVALLAEAAAGQAELLAVLDAMDPSQDAAAVADLRTVLREQLAAVSDDPPTPTAGPLTGEADGALSAGSLAVVKVLAAMSAGLEQVAVAAGRLT